MSDARPAPHDDPGARLAARLAEVPRQRDFAFSATPARAAWVCDDTIEWVDGDWADGDWADGDWADGDWAGGDWAGDDWASGPRRQRGRFAPGGALPAGTQLELISAELIGVCRSTDAGVEVLAVDVVRGRTASIASFMTPRTCLLPRAAGEADQLLAVNGFDGVSTLYRIEWHTGTVREAGQLPAPVTGGTWTVPGRSLALNLTGPSGRSSVYAVDVDAGRFNLLFEASPDTEDRIVLFDADSGLAVFTTDAFAYPAVGIARPGDPAGVRCFPALESGDEAPTPCAFVTLDGRRRIVVHHEDGTFARLRLADPEAMTISEPLALPDGEVGTPVAVHGGILRFPFSAPDQPWRAARFDLGSGTFTLEPETHPEASGRRAPFRPGRSLSLEGPAGPMPALRIDPDPAHDRGDLAVVALHGGPIARFGAEWSAELQLFAGLGVPVVALDYPGSTGWGQEYMRSLFGAAGSLDVGAVTAVVDGLAASGRRVILYGESYGAFLALLAAGARPCAGVIAFAPFASFARLKQCGSPEVRETLELLDAGNSDETGRNALEACRINRSRVLIVHGTADKTIPVQESRSLAEALRERKGVGEDAVRIVELERQGHELNGRVDLARYYLEIARFVGDLQ